MAIAPGLGSFVSIGTLVTDAVLVDEAPEPVREGCGSCTRCLDACPTGALVEPGVLDSRRCLSYWTQSRHAAPADVQDALEDRVYGCDICQDVCPYNAGPARRGADLEPEGEAWVSLVDWLELPDDELLQRYGRLYVPDRDPRYLRRNALVALGNGPEEHRHLAEPFARGERPDPRAGGAAGAGVAAQARDAASARTMPSSSSARPATRSRRLSGASRIASPRCLMTSLSR